MSEEKKDTVKKKRLEIGVACIFRDKKVLIQTRPKGKSFAGKWEFPGGKIEEGERARDCTARKIKEELGAKIKVGSMFFKNVHHFDTVVLVLLFYKCKLIDQEEPRPQENQEIQWISVDQFKDFKFLPTNKKILNKLREIPELN